MATIMPRITFRHMDHSDLLAADFTKNLEKVLKFLENEPSPIVLDAIFDANKLHPTSSVEILLKTPHYACVAKAEGADMYQLIDEAIKKLLTELRREKDRRIDRVHKRHTRPA